MSIDSWNQLGHHYGDACNPDDAQAENDLAADIWQANQQDGRPNVSDTYVPLSVRYPHQFEEHDQ